MKRTFCDICDQQMSEKLELPETVDFRSRIRDRDLTVVISDNCNGDICLHCFVDAVKELDLRPTAS